jgi:hypothetical protein
MALAASVKNSSDRRQGLSVPETHPYCRIEWLLAISGALALVRAAAIERFSAFPLSITCGELRKALQW